MNKIILVLHPVKYVYLLHYNAEDYIDLVVPIKTELRLHSYANQNQP